MSRKNAWWMANRERETECHKMVDGRGRGLQSPILIRSPAAAGERSQGVLKNGFLHNNDGKCETIVAVDNEGNLNWREEATDSEVIRRLNRPREITLSFPHNCDGC